jgi:hypothetical protein
MDNRRALIFFGALGRNTGLMGWLLQKGAAGRRGVVVQVARTAVN